MHPVISQAVATERSRDRQAYAASCLRVAEIRASRPARRRLPFIRVAGTGPSPRAPRALRALRPLRAPRTA
jgi:hypothetical protein